jgi:SAM-dependent methyltransferase
MMKVSQQQVQECNNLLLGKSISAKTASKIAKRINDQNGSTQQYLVELFLSHDFLSLSLKNAAALHLFYAHNARLQLVSSLLPKAEKIIDLGGANGSIYEMGYPHKFEEIIVVDLPPSDRDPMYKDLELKPEKTPNGNIRVHFGDMSDLSFLPDNSVDLVWSGESIEHIDEEAGKRMVREAFRVLRPGASFCLDTPNRLITQIHTTGFIHPEHKLEYYPKQLQKVLRQAGFKIIDQRGIREMPRTHQTKEFNYADYITGSPISKDVESSYMQYYHCVKPVPLHHRPKVRRITSTVKRALKPRAAN